MHIRYEDRLPNGDRVAAGLTLSSLNFQSMGADGQSFSSGPDFCLFVGLLV